MKYEKPFIYALLIINSLIFLALIFGLFYRANNIIIQDDRENPLYENVIKRFADTHTYNLSSYNCVNYSQDLGIILNNLGYKTEQLIIRNETSAHQKILLILEIEPQTGEITINRK